MIFCNPTHCPTFRCPTHRSVLLVVKSPMVTPSVVYSSHFLCIVEVTRRSTLPCWHPCQSCHRKPKNPCSNYTSRTLLYTSRWLPRQMGAQEQISMRPPVKKAEARRIAAVKLEAENAFDREGVGSRRIVCTAFLVRLTVLSFRSTESFVWSSRFSPTDGIDQSRVPHAADYTYRMHIWDASTWGGRHSRCRRRSNQTVVPPGV